MADTSWQVTDAFWRMLSSEQQEKLKNLAEKQGISLARTVTRPGDAFPSPPSVIPGIEALDELAEKNGWTTLEGLLGSHVRHPKTPKATRWAVGVVSASRRVETLPETMRRLTQAGWVSSDTCTVRIFRDGDSSFPSSFSDEFSQNYRSMTTFRGEKVLAWPNYFLGLQELFLRCPNADVFLMLEDDAFLFDRRNVREYLETHVLWPRTDCGVVSLYTSSKYQPGRFGWFPFPPMDSSYVWGSLAFLFSHQTIREFLRSRHAQDHRLNGFLNTPDDPLNGTRDADALVGSWLRSKKYTMWLPSPSLVEHGSIGTTVWSYGDGEDRSLEPRGSSRNCKIFAGDFLDGYTEQGLRWLKEEYYVALRRQEKHTSVASVEESDDVVVPVHPSLLSAIERSREDFARLEAESTAVDRLESPILPSSEIELPCGLF